MRAWLAASLTAVRRFLLAAVAIAALSTSALWAIDFYLSSAELPTNVPGQANKDPESGGSSRNSVDYVAKTLGLSWPEGATVVAAISAFIAWLVWQAMHDTAERQLRAYVFATDFRLWQVAHRPVLNFIVINRGSTPARQVEIRSVVAVLGRFGPNGSKPVPVPLPPQVPTPVMHEYFVEFADNEFATALRVPLSVLVKGEIAYRDVFDKQRLTTFAMYSTGAFGAEGNLELAAMDRGNDFT